MTRGVRGAVLDSVLIGGIRYTSEEAIERFTRQQNPERPATSPDQRQAAIERAERELSAAGI